MSTRAMAVRKEVNVLAIACICVVLVLAEDASNSLYGPSCVSCTGARDPAECQDTTQCWASQQCYTERYIHADGHPLYDFGCKIKEECTLIEQNRGRKKRLDITIDLCEECCHGELCNVNTCTNRTETTEMTCYTCEAEGNPRDCHVLRRCNNGEMCYAEKVITDSPHPVFTLGCLSQQICHVLETGAQTLIGRSLGKSRNKRATHLCQKCCSTSGCNAELCDSGEVTVGQVTSSSRSTSPYFTSPSTRLISTTISTTTSTTHTMPSTTPESGTVRLVNGSTPKEGRVEIFHNGEWGTICDDGFNVKAASVVCKMLGYQSAQVLVHPKAYFGSGSGMIWLDDVICTGEEDSISNCTNRGWGITNCVHNEDVGVTCLPGVRLVNGNSPNEGTVEIYHEGQWGTVCDDSFDKNAASVVCHMLGYPRTLAVAWSRAHFGSGTGPIWLDDVRCNGDEDSIADCRHAIWGRNNCAKSEDAGVSCYAAHCMDGAVNYNDSCYVFNPTDKVNTYDEALNACKNLNTTLVTIDSVDEREFIEEQLRNMTTSSSGEWMTDGRFTNGHWVWSQSGNLVDMGILIWGPGEPSGQGCMSFWRDHNYHLADVNCNGYPRNYICEKTVE